MRSSTALSERIRDRAGVALPVALFGMVALSLLVTSALATSSTELAISGAQQDATQSFYSAEEGLERFVASVDAALQAGGSVPACSNCQVAISNSRTAIVNVVRLDSVAPAGGDPGYEIYCAIARNGSGGGREIGAMFRVNFTSNPPLDLNLQAAATFGEDVRMQGSAKVFGRQTNTGRCSDQTQVAALQYSQDASFTQNGSVQQIGGIQQTGETKAQMESRILNGVTPTELAQSANIRFDPTNPFDKDHNGGKAPHSDNPLGSKYNWGCPGTMVSCDPVGKPSQDTTYYPVVDIDAGGAEIHLNGSNHGQGVLLIRNGRLKINGSFDYKGVIIVEGAVDIMGTAKIDGALVALGTVTVGKTADDRSDLAGTMEINYDPCVIARAQEAFNENASSGGGTRSLEGGSFAWFEVLR